MKINWKVRFKNPVFLAQLALNIFTPILGYYNLTAQDITTWTSLFNLLKEAFSNPYVLSITLVGVWSAINDATTHGFFDSKNALNYEKPKKDQGDVK